jgi:hypothetical protein
VVNAAGFEQVAILEQFDCFRGTSKERTAKKYGVIGVNVLAVKPERAGQ